MFGAFGDCIEDVHQLVHQLVQRLAKAKVAKADTEPGYRATGKSKEAQLSAEVAFLRRRLSMAAVREQARLLIDRPQLLGDGAGQAARRREFAERSRRDEHSKCASCKADQSEEAALLCWSERDSTL